MVFGGSTLMEWLGYAPSTVLVQLFVPLCRETDQEASLKKQHTPHLNYFHSGSVSKHNSPHLHCATGVRVLQWESVARSRQTGVCLIPQCLSPWPKASGRISLQQPQATCLSELETSKKRKERLNPCRHMLHLHTIFLCKT